MIKFKPLIISLLLSLGVGGLSGFLTSNSMKVYSSLVQPPFSPPGWVFPIVWTILFTLMGISAYLVYISDSATLSEKKLPLTIYGIQLLVNFIWPLIFFGAGQYFLSFIWILLLVALVITMITLFYNTEPWAAYLQIPYLLWLIFATYLNLSIYFLNQ